LGDPNPNIVEITLNSTISKANPSASSTCGSLPSIEIEVDSTSDESNNSQTCSFTLENCTVSDTTSTQGIFSYKIASNVFTYWITDASTIVASSSETLDVNLTLTDSANYEFTTGQSPISVTMVGQVNGKATSLGVDDDSAIALGDVEQNAVTTGKKITINDADNLASATISVSGGGFKISATDDNYGTDDVTINDPVNKDFYIKLDSSGEVGNANSTVTVSGTKSAKGASNPSDVTIDCTANITEPAGGGGGGGDCCADPDGNTTNWITSPVTAAGQTGTANWGVTIEQQASYNGSDTNKKVCYKTTGAASAPTNGLPVSVILSLGAWDGVPQNLFNNFVAEVKFSASGVQDAIGDNLIFIDEAGTCYEPSVSATTYQESTLGFGMNVVVLQEKV